MLVAFERALEVLTSFWLERPQVRKIHDHDAGEQRNVAAAIQDCE
jgi:hypothetical protein